MNVTYWLERMTDPDDEVRAEASEELNEGMDDDVVAGLLLIVANHEDEEVRADAIIALGPIVEMAGMEYDDEVDFDFDEELGPGITRETYLLLIDRLRAIYDDASLPKLVRRRAFEVLVRDPRGWQAVEVRKYFAADDAEWKLSAVFAMGHIAGFEKDLAALVRSAEGLMLVEAVRSAGAQGVTAAGKRIADVAMDERADLYLRLVAIAALSNVHKNSTEILEELTLSGNEEIVEAAEAALEEVSLDEDWDGDDD